MKSYIRVRNDIDGVIEPRNVNNMNACNLKHSVKFKHQPSSNVCCCVSSQLSDGRFNNNSINSIGTLGGALGGRGSGKDKDKGGNEDKNK